VQDLASPYGRIRAVSLLYINIFTMRAREFLSGGGQLAGLFIVLDLSQPPLIRINKRAAV
jgi:hypothetical protein